MTPFAREALDCYRIHSSREQKENSRIQLERQTLMQSRTTLEAVILCGQNNLRVIMVCGQFLRKKKVRLNYKTITKKSLAVLCSIIKYSRKCQMHLGSKEKHTRPARVSPILLYSRRFLARAG